MKKICIVTGTRAEWGLLSRLASIIEESDNCILQIIACNMHLSAEYGNTYKEIERAGFNIDWRVDMLLSGDSASATTKSVGLGTIGFADAYAHLLPDMLVILGDRYEMLAAASAALFFKIPIAHISGGDVTEGAYDDSIRHAITKLSHLHFTSTEEYRNRVIQLGEEPNRVYNVGAIGIDNIRQLKLMSKGELEDSIGGFEVDRDTLLATFHPATLDAELPINQIGNLLSALDDYMAENSSAKIIFTMPNSDTDGKIIADKIKEWVSTKESRAVWFNSLGMMRYLSTLQYIGGVIGNSSSGIVEVPSFGIPTLNIGDRQKGRIYSEGVFHTTTSKEDILLGLNQIKSYTPTSFKNDYEKANTTQNIFDVIGQYIDSNIIVKKFYDVF